MQLLALALLGLCWAPSHTLSPRASPSLSRASTELSPRASADLITDLPGLSFNMSRQFSGYLEADAGVFFHYWLIESQSSPSTDPLLIWFNGGPGCSSLDGLLSELGPIHVKMGDDGKPVLYENEYAWTKFSNVVFLESPACVGFSYTNGSCATGDDQTSLRNYHALLDFYEKFPEYVSREFFVTGESYGGVYIPTLVKRIIQGMGEHPINLKGFAVGNGLTSYEENSASLIFFAYYHGLIDQDLWDKTVGVCCAKGSVTREACDFTTGEGQCDAYLVSINDLINNPNINIYDLYGKCEHSSVSGSGHSTTLTRQDADKYNLFMHKHTSGNSPRVSMDPPCVSSLATREYLNSKDVRQALHIPDAVQDWELCSAEVGDKWDRQYTDMTDVYNFIHEAGIKGLIYNGDVDMACNYLGDQWFIEKLNYNVTAERRIWMSEGQVGGFVKRFDLIDLLTVRGSGHMVPQNKPAPALHMIQAFVQGTDY